ncbi:PA14 domain-containing protein [Saccharicrinis carchari]|uniref:PA14 domain-containing protein n=1 Tax=Saccharicrinis carchari TaxID=1168039 RepID=A0A521B5E4_SACCC|nr:metallophosphoesterase [Saccharicrinis carchari]SMO42295.1 PA14 domain-containing protein [Saccharicrinis carchari]
MKHIYHLSIVVILLFHIGITLAGAQDKVELRFNNEGTFKIAQITDTHWNNSSDEYKKTEETIRIVLRAEKPDLAVLTGDIVTADPAKEGWLSLAKIFEEEKIPWAVTLGNHDAEPDVTRNGIFEILEGLPYFVGEAGDVHGAGNYALPVKGAKGNSTAAVLYCIDSNDYSSNPMISNYDWIRFDQIAWYRNKSDEFTAANNQMPLPSLAFFHIPLIEYNEIVGAETTVGDQYEGVASADINSGMFASFIDKNDVIGVFVGHDHDNNYIGIHKGIGLAFGQRSGFQAYGQLEPGCRIIRMHEGDFSYDTWIRTPSGTDHMYYFPSGLAAYDENTEFSPAKNVGKVKPGVKYKYFEGEFSSTDELSGQTPKKTGLISNISLAEADVTDYFGFEYNALINIPVKGLYRFYTYSDDGSKLLIDGKVVVDNDGSHSAKREEGVIALDKGFHEFKLLYFESYMGEKLEVGFSSVKIRECIIPDSFFFVEE